MAEIKSSIELAMERTRGLTLSEEEKRSLQDEKAHRAAHALAAQYLRGDVDVEGLMHKAAALEEGARQGLLQGLVDGLRLGSEAFTRGADALERWKGRDHRQCLHRLRDLSVQFGHALQKRRKKLRATLWEDLARRGVEGSAVEPHVEASAPWKAAVEELGREFEPRLGEIKAALLQPTGK